MTFSPQKARKPMKRSGRITSKKRSASEFRRIYGSRARVAWVKSLPCVVCVAINPAISRGRSENAHTETGGMGYKAGYETIAPLCSLHHRLYDEHQYPYDNELSRQFVKSSAILTQLSWLRSQEGA